MPQFGLKILFYVFLLCAIGFLAIGLYALDFVLLAIAGLFIVISLLMGLENGQLDFLKFKKQN